MQREKGKLRLLILNHHCYTGMGFVSQRDILYGFVDNNIKLEIG